MKNPALSADIGHPLFRREPRMFGGLRAIVRMLQGKGRGPRGTLSQKQKTRIAVRHGKA